MQILHNRSPDTISTGLTIWHYALKQISCEHLNQVSFDYFHSISIFECIWTESLSCGINNPSAHTLSHSTCLGLRVERWLLTDELQIMWQRKQQIVHPWYGGEMKSSTLRKYIDIDTWIAFVGNKVILFQHEHFCLFTREYRYTDIQTLPPSLS